MEKNTQLDKERQDEVTRLTSENTRLKERVTKLDKDFASKPLTAQLLIPISTIHHAQHGLLLKCSCTPKRQYATGGIDKGKRAPGVEV
jgi:hypothetical protein